MTNVYHAAKIVEIEPDRAGQRLDNYLFLLFKSLPRSRVYKMLRKGEVRINGGRVKQHYRLKAGDKLRLPPVHLDDAGHSGSVPRSMVEKIEQAVLYEDKDLLVLNKLSGLAVHTGSGVDYGVIEALRQSRPELPFLELVHRLDRSTSGCLLLARNRAALNYLHTLLRNNGISKHYLVLLAGQWQGGEKRIQHRLLTDSAAQRKTRVHREGKIAISNYKPLQVTEEASLMEVSIETGRTHQIRVQSAALGHPVLGDDKYGDFQLNRQWRRRGLRRLFLHAAKLEFDGVSEKHYQFNAPVPEELKPFIKDIDEKNIEKV